MKTTLKSLEKRIEKLEFHEKNTIKILEDIDNRIKFLEKQDIHNSTNKFAEDAIKVHQPKYDVGDYVETVFNSRGIIMEIDYIQDVVAYIIEVDGKTNHYHENEIIGYAPHDLLTEEEKEYLSAVIRPFRDSAKYIQRWNDVIIEDLKYITIYDVDKRKVISTFLNQNKYNNLELGKFYTLEELGL